MFQYAQSSGGGGGASGASSAARALGYGPRATSSLVRGYRLENAATSLRRSSSAQNVRWSGTNIDAQRANLSRANRMDDIAARANRRARQLGRQ